MLSNTAFAYPIEQFPNALPYTKTKVQPNEVQERDIIRFGDRLRTTTTTDINISPISTSSMYVTRSEFLTAVVDGMYPDGIPATCFEQLSPSNYWRLFRDVPNGATYGPHLCAGMIAGIVKGYDDITFRPLKPINYAEAAKILAKAHGIANDTSDANSEWFTPFVEAMNARGAMPANVQLDDLVSPANMATMVRALN